MQNSTLKLQEPFRDSHSRQVSEGVEIRRSSKTVLNAQSEWHQKALWEVQKKLSISVRLHVTHTFSFPFILTLFITDYYSGTESIRASVCNATAAATATTTARFLSSS